MDNMWVQATFAILFAFYFAGGMVAAIVFGLQCVEKRPMWNALFFFLLTICVSLPAFILLMGMQGLAALIGELWKKFDRPIFEEEDKYGTN